MKAYSWSFFTSALPSTLPPRKSLPVPLDRRLGRPQNLSGRYGEENNFAMPVTCPCTDWAIPIWREDDVASNLLSVASVRSWITSFAQSKFNHLIMFSFPGTPIRWWLSAKTVISELAAMSFVNIQSDRCPIPTLSSRFLRRPHYYYLKLHVIVFFSSAIIPLQGGASTGMPQEDGGHVIESWRVTTAARVCTTNYSQACVYLLSRGVL